MKSFWISKSSSLLIAGLLGAGTLTAQLAAPEPDVIALPPPAETFLFPIMPGQPAYLAGTLGEFRNTHFHAGIDIGTHNVVGIPVVAAQRGYVSRISVSAGGYGNAIYMTHPDGQVTLYGHLSRFDSPLGDYIRREQYRRKSFDLDLFFRNDQFVYAQGDTIGFSGNSGSSQGPHLHFEVRSPNPIAMNPLGLGFKEVTDHQPPVAQKVALKTLDIHSRINDRFGRFEFYLVRTATGYILPHPVLATGRIGIEVLAYDKTDNSRARTGINTYELSVDSMLLFRQHIDRVDLSQPRSILYVMDYKAMVASGARFNKLYRDGDNTLPYYEDSPSGGQIPIDGGTMRSVSIGLTDLDGNKTQVSLRLKPSPRSEKAWSLTPAKELAFEVLDNTLIVSAPACPADSNRLTISAKGHRTAINPTYSGNGRFVYLLDLRQSLPDSLILCGTALATQLKATVPPGLDYTYYSDKMNIHFSRRSLLDTVHLAVSHARVSDSLEVFRVGDGTTPLAGSIGISLKPVNRYEGGGRWEVYHKTRRNNYSYVYSEWRNDRLHFRTSELGEFVILPDTIPPAIRVRSIGPAGARFKIADYRSGVDSFEASLDGKWLLMTYDAKSGTLQSERLDVKEPFKGELELRVVDNAGNRSIFKQKIL